MTRHEHQHSSTPCRRLLGLGAASAAAALLMLSGPAPADPMPDFALATGSALAVADDPAGSPGDAQRTSLAADARSGFYSAAVGQLLFFDCEADGRVQLTRAADRADELGTSTRGSLLLHVLDRRGDELLVAARFPVAEARLHSGAQSALQRPDDPLCRDLAAATIVRMRDDGTMLGLAFPAGAAPESRNWIRTLWAGSVCVLRGADGQPWTAEEGDAFGRAELAYRWTRPIVEDGSTRGGGVHRRKVRYVAHRQIPSAVTVDGEGEAHCNPNLGWLETSHYRERLSCVIADAGITVQSQLRVVCTLRDIGFEPATGDVDWDLHWSPANGSDDLPGDRLAAIRQRYQQRLAGATADTLVARLGELAGQAAGEGVHGTLVDLAWLIRLRPEALARLMELLPRLDAATAELVLIAAGASETPAAQSWLSQLFGDPAQPEHVSRTAAMALMQVQQPDDGAVLAFAGHVDHSGRSNEVALAGELALGTLTGRAGGAASEQALATLLALEPRAAARGTLVNWLEALGNAGVPGIFPAASRYLAHGDADVRASAIAAMRSLEGAEVVAAVVAGAGDPAPQVRAQAAEVLARSAEPAALAALARLLGSDSDPYVRGATARALAARAREPAVRVLLEQAARSDTDADVRAAAVQVLTRS